MLQLHHKKPQQWLVRGYQITIKYADYRNKVEYPMEMSEEANTGEWAVRRKSLRSIVKVS